MADLERQTNDCKSMYEAADKVKNSAELKAAIQIKPEGLHN